ncbi:MAG: sugar ABC transporter permease [Clostridiaceae bacterium]
MKAIQRRRVLFSLLPLALILGFIYAYPLVKVCFNAFTGFTGSSAGKFVGLKNFSLISADVPQTVVTTLIWTFGSVIPAMLLGLVLALVCNRNFAGKRAVVSLSLLPYAIPLIIVASCWRFVYNPDFGIINVFLKKIGLISDSVSFLGFKNALGSVIVARIWRATPFAFMNYYSALTTIPAEQYEAACVDGANSVQRFFRITLPNLKTITASTLIVLTVWTFMVFDIIYGMTGGGPVDATKTIPMRIYQEMFGMKNLGTASAWSLIAIAVLVTITIIYWNISGKEDA